MDALILVNIWSLIRRNCRLEGYHTDNKYHISVVVGIPTLHSRIYASWFHGYLVPLTLSFNDIVGLHTHIHVYHVHSCNTQSLINWHVHTPVLIINSQRNQGRELW